MSSFIISVIVYPVKSLFSTSSPIIIIKDASTGKAASKSPVPSQPSPGLTEDEQKHLNKCIYSSHVKFWKKISVNIPMMGIYKLIKLVLNSLNENLSELGMTAFIAAYGLMNTCQFGQMILTFINYF